MTAALRIARVAVAAPIRRLFDYFILPDQPPPKPGVRVCVPFGPRRTTVGVVVALAGGSDVPRARLKTVVQVLDAEPLLSESSLSLLCWASEYYHHPIGEVIAAALPSRLRRRANLVGGINYWTLTAAGAAADPGQLKGALVQRRILAAIKAAPQGLEAIELGAVSRRWKIAVDRMMAKGWLEIGERRAPGPCRHGPPALLSDAQREAVDAITAAPGFQPFLLYGVTGSGKTEVYLRVIAAAIDRGDQALMLVPEIGLTPQLATRLQAGLGVPIAVLHSGLNDRARAAAWGQAALGKVQLVVGTRSAVFTPLPRLRVIIVDEEHDASYKQQDGFRYSARDVAVMRARHEAIPIVLGSATPSLESLNHARAGTYRRLSLPARAAGAELPTIELLDMRRIAIEEGLSQPLRAALADTLERGEQALLFLNRRGFAPVWMCFHCGWVAPCKRCDARLTFHRASARLRCHHCGAEQAPVDTCPNCREPGLHALGQGTERVEAVLARRFPDARIIRIDRDSTRSKGALERSLERIRAGAADVLIGTQMLAKGHDFPNVTLVGILHADQGLYGGDFRADERLAQQIIQVSGRAGRAAKRGRVLVQTYHPDHPVFAALRRHDYDAFTAYALAERRAAGFPPFGYLALLRAESPTPQAALKFLSAARALIFRFPLDSDVQVMQPVPSPMERRAGRYRAQLLIRAARRAPLHALLDHCVERLSQMKQARRVRWSLDVDPGDLY